jgi:pimeloyl-ACP methyl ester carboxylesterase
MSIYWDSRGEGPPILLIMGYGMSGKTWAPLLPLFAGYRAIWFDNRGTGRSSKPESAYSVADMAEDALSVLDAAGVDRANVIGVSMGGMIAQQLTLEHPDRVDRLVLCCTSPGAGARDTGDPAALFELVEATKLLSSDPPAAMQRFKPILLAPGNEDLLDRFGGEVVSSDGAPEFASPTTADVVMTSLAGFSSLQRLGEIVAPTLVQHGDLDRIVPVDHGRQLAELIPNATMEEYAGCGHLYLIEDPRPLLGILEFVGRGAT